MLRYLSDFFSAEYGFVVLGVHDRGFLLQRALERLSVHWKGRVAAVGSKQRARNQNPFQQYRVGIDAAGNETVQPETLAQVLARLTKMRESLLQGYRCNFDFSGSERQGERDAIAVRPARLAGFWKLEMPGQ